MRGGPRCAGAFKPPLSFYLHLLAWLSLLFSCFLAGPCFTIPGRLDYFVRGSIHHWISNSALFFFIRYGAKRRSRLSAATSIGYDYPAAHSDPCLVMITRPWSLHSLCVTSLCIDLRTLLHTSFSLLLFFFLLPCLHVVLLGHIDCFNLFVIFFSVFFLSSLFSFCSLASCIGPNLNHRHVS